MEKEKLLNFRFNQSMGSRLIEYITGIRPDNPEIVNRLINDQKILRAKYNLPKREIKLNSPSEYEHLLIEIAEKNNITIRDKSEYSQFFEKNLAEAVYFGEPNSVFVGINRNNQSSYVKGLGVLEHELIHGEQEAYFKNMPIELQEYEAYIASNINVNEFKNKSSEYIEDALVFYIGRSVTIWYKIENEKKELESKPLKLPVWRDPEFFLKNIDKINQSDIELYKAKIKE